VLQTSSIDDFVLTLENSLIVSMVAPSLDFQDSGGGFCNFKSNPVTTHSYSIRLFLTFKFFQIESTQSALLYEDKNVKKFFSVFFAYFCKKPIYF